MFPCLGLLYRSASSESTNIIASAFASLQNSNPRVNNVASWILKLEQEGIYSSPLCINALPIFSCFSYEHPWLLALYSCARPQVVLQPTSITNFLRGYVKLLLSNRKQLTFCSKIPCSVVNNILLLQPHYMKLWKNTQTSFIW